MIGIEISSYRSKQEEYSETNLKSKLRFVPKVLKNICESVVSSKEEVISQPPSKKDVDIVTTLWICQRF